MSGFTLTRTDEADIPVPATDKATIFLDAAGVPSYKDDADVVTSLVGADGAAGATGPAGADAVSTFTLPLNIGDGIIVVPTGSKGLFEIPYACTITAARLAADVSGSCVIDIKKASYSGLFSTSSICASAKPTLSSARKSEDTTLTGWTVSISAGDWLEIVVDSASTIKRVTLSLTFTR